jgi:hypothetical protein
MERTAEEWGRVAVALPGWRWMEGLWWTVRRDAPLEDLRGVVQVERRDLSPPPYAGAVPDVDHPATAGCLLALLGRAVRVVSEDTTCAPDWYYRAHVPFHLSHDGRGYGIAEPTLGRACIAAAEALGRWPGGGQ